MFEQKITSTEIAESSDLIDDKIQKEHARFSPLISPLKELASDALEVSNIIDNNGRKTIAFNRYLVENDIDYIPECIKNEDMLLDTDTGAKQTGKLDYDTYKRVLETKKICAECPLRMECLAISMTESRRTRTSKNEKSIPGTEDTLPIVMSEYLMFGGYTPQERKIIYDMICHILEERDDILNE